MKQPVVSIIMATRDHGRFIAASIESALNQSFKDFELIIVNDGSVDNTEAIVDSYIRRDPRIVYLKNETNQGVPKSFNFAMKVAKGKYIARIDSDDAWIGEDKLKKQVAFLEAHPDYAAVGGGMVVVDPQSNELFRYLKPETDKQTRANALITNPIANSTSVCRKDAVVAIGGCDESYPFNEDWDFWLHIGLIGKFYNFPEYFSYYTMTGRNKSMRFLRQHTKVALSIIRKYKNHYPSYRKGLFVNTLQYLYGFVPFFIRLRLNPFLSRVKKKLAGSSKV